MVIAAEAKAGYSIVAYDLDNLKGGRLVYKSADSTRRPSMFSARRMG